MTHGDHVRIIGRDGLYVFLKEVQGTATLQLVGRKSIAGRKSLDEALAIPIEHIVSLEQANIRCPHPSKL